MFLLLFDFKTHLFKNSGMIILKTVVIPYFFCILKKIISRIGSTIIYLILLVLKIDLEQCEKYENNPTTLK